MHKRLFNRNQQSVRYNSKPFNSIVSIIARAGQPLMNQFSIFIFNRYYIICIVIRLYTKRGIDKNKTVTKRKDQQKKSHKNVNEIMSSSIWFDKVEIEMNEHIHTYTELPFNITHVYIFWHINMYMDCVAYNKYLCCHLPYHISCWSRVDAFFNTKKKLTKKISQNA